MQRWAAKVVAGVLLLAAGLVRGQDGGQIAAMLRSEDAAQRRRGYVLLFSSPAADAGRAADVLADVRIELCLRIARQLAAARPAGQQFAGVYETWEQTCTNARLLVEQSVGEPSRAKLAKVAADQAEGLYDKVAAAAKTLDAELAALTAEADRLEEIDRIAPQARLAVPALDHTPAALDEMLGGASRLAAAVGYLNRWKRLQQIAAECDKLNRAAGARPDTAAGALLAATNRYRLRLGLMPLIWNALLARSAGEHATEMQRLGYVSHTSPTAGRTTPEDRIRAAGYEGYLSIGENVAGGFSRADAVFAAFCESPAHHRNLVDAAYREIGVAVAGDKWAMNFGAPTRSPWAAVRPIVLSWPSSRPFQQNPGPTTNGME